jgi:hypothetical protein
MHMYIIYVHVCRHCTRTHYTLHTNVYTTLLHMYGTCIWCQCMFFVYMYCLACTSLHNVTCIWMHADHMHIIHVYVCINLHGWRTFGNWVAELEQKSNSTCSITSPSTYVYPCMWMQLGCLLMHTYTYMQCGVHCYNTYMYICQTVVYMYVPCIQ